MNTPLPVNNSRPATVTAAAAMQFMQAAIGVITVALAMIYGDTINSAMQRSLETSGMAANEAEMYATAGGNDPLTLSVSIVLAAILAVLAFLLLRGNNVGRIITWVVSGLGLACTALVTGMGALMAGATESIGFDEAMADGFAAAGGWYSPLTTAMMIVSIVGYIAVIVLLALPASHPYFRKAGPEVQLPPEAG